MTKIKNIDDLRDEMLFVFEKVSKKEIDLADASIMAKISETVISGINVQLKYAALTNQDPHIKFLEDKKTKLIK